MNKVKSENLSLAVLSNLLYFNHKLLFYLKDIFYSWQNIFLAKRNDFKYLKITEKQINKIIYIKERNLLSKLEEMLDKNKIKLLTYKDSNFPSLLKEVKNSPLVLFYQGALHNLSSKYFSIVGSRKHSLNAKKTLDYLLDNLNTNYSLVSGLALGVDSFAHQAALNNNLHTCAILGSGLNNIYPQQNIRLAKDILVHQGCLISQFLPFQKPLKHHFPLRNQIIAGMSNSTLVLEAKKRSGALITANLALEYGRNVAAVPGNVLEESYQGSNKLIKDGAIVINEPEDIKELLLDSNF
jgi:DNA processing protein